MRHKCYSFKWPNRDPLGEPGFETLRFASQPPYVSSLQDSHIVYAGDIVSALTYFRLENGPDDYIPNFPAEELENPNLYGFVANNPINYVDPLGLWQFTIGGGFGDGLLFTIGKNGGGKWYQGWNTGLFGGEGAGLYWDYNDTDSGCHKKGIEPGWKAKGGLGDTLNAEYEAEGDLNEINASVSHSYEGTGLDVTYSATLNGEGLSTEGPSLTPTSGWGAGEFFGIGGTVYW